MTKLVDSMKAAVKEAMKAKRDVEKEILRVALSEIQLVENRAGKEISEEDAAKVVRKLIASNEETLAATTQEEAKARLAEENRVLTAYLPKVWGEAEITAALQAVLGELKAAKSDGQATGVAMKALKSQGAPVIGDHVSAVVKKLRQA